jgi:hypothetical protein
MVFTATIHPDAFTAFKRAEASFKTMVDRRKQDSEQLLKALEVQAKRDAALNGRVTPEVQHRIDELKSELSAITHLTWREHDAHKSTMVEVMKRSKFRSMTFIDEFGSRVSAGLSNPARMSVEASWMSLTDIHSGDVAFIRSSSTGGATIHSLTGEDKTRFQYLSASSVEVVNKLASKVSKKLHMAAMKGRTIAVPVRYGSKPALGLTADTLLAVMRNVALRGEQDASERVRLTFESDEVRQAWESFLSVGFTDVTGKELSEEAWKAVERMPASFRTLTAFATKAAFTQAVLDASNPSAGVTVQARHLELAWLLLHALLAATKTFDYLSTRAENAAKARAAKAPSDPQVVEAGKCLDQAIRSSDRRMISRKTALQLPGVTPSILDHLGNADQKRWAELIVEKNRNGKTGNVELLFFPRRTLFSCKPRYGDRDLPGKPAPKPEEEADEES